MDSVAADRPFGRYWPAASAIGLTQPRPAAENVHAQAAEKRTRTNPHELKTNPNEPKRTQIEHESKRTIFPTGAIRNRVFAPQGAHKENATNSNRGGALPESAPGTGPPGRPPGQRSSPRRRRSQGGARLRQVLTPGPDDASRLAVQRGNGNAPLNRRRTGPGLPAWKLCPRS